MPHVELSLSEEDDQEEPERQETFPEGRWTGQLSSVRRWAQVAAVADEPCVLLDADGMIVVSSPACRALLGTDGLPHPTGAHRDWTGRGLLDVLRLVDLTASGAPLASWEAERIPPLLALATGNLARGLIRVRLGDRSRTADVVSTPLRDAGAVVGSLSFLRQI